MGETDLISRQAAVDRINKQREHLKPDIDERDAIGDAAYRVCAEFIERLPSAPPKKVCVAEIKVEIDDIKDYIDKAINAERWIPCSERLPDKPNMYTVTDSKGDVVRFVFYDNESSREYWMRCAKAWMPLPEPYKGEQE